MKSLIPFTLVCILFIGCSKDRLTANGDQTTETRFPGEFTGLNTSGSNRVHVEYGTTFEVELKGSANLLPAFKTKIMSGTLYVGYENASVQHDDVEVFITLPQIKKVSISGTSHVNLEGFFEPTDRFNLSISGSGQILAEDVFETEKLHIDISGKGNADLQNVICEEADVNISGKGDASITVHQKLKARISGSGRVYYNGDPIVDSDISGSGKVVKL